MCPEIGAMESKKQALNSSVSDTYDGRSIFVTGSTGFIGKVFVEKILYRCPKVEKVYVLIRDTEKVSFEVKFKKMLDSPLFRRLKEERPQDLEKLVPVIGDISQSNLGLKIEDEKLLIENVSMVFHFAATIKFNEPLQYAIDINLEGTRRVLDLCVRMQKIKVFVYVSTAFTGATRKILDEVVYPPPISEREVDEIMKQKIVTEEQTRKILNGNPNTYTLTKALAENLVARFHERAYIPTVIVRPSIVVSCKDEPIVGWIDNWFGATALVVTVGKGLIRTLFGDGNNVIDLIPADYVANLAIVAAARSDRSKSLEVYNSCTSASNPITLNELAQTTTNYYKKHKSNEFPLPGLYFATSKWIMAIVIFLLETLPAYIADCYLRVIGKKPMYMKLQSRTSDVRKALEPFSSRTWTMRSPNTCALSESLSPNDRKLFACDPTTIDWQDFLPTYCQGIEKYLMGNKIR